MHLAAHDDGTAPQLVGRLDPGPAEDQSARGKVRTRNNLHQLLEADLRVGQGLDAGIDHLAQIVRRNIGGHADGDAARAIDQQIGKPRRQHHRLALGIVVVVLEIDRVLVDVFQQRMRRLVHAHFGVTHGRGRVAVDGAEIALPVQQRQTQGKVLRHAHQRVIDRLVTMRVILTDHVTDHAGRLAVGLVPVVAVLTHREQDAAMHRLQAVTRIRQRTADDHAHGVIEIGRAHLVLDGDAANTVRGAVRRRRTACGRLAAAAAVGGVAGHSALVHGLVIIDV